ncbi:MAG: amidohydrolase [Pseudomonadales bacterium]|nr:amidohydrolase [Pseudomonadales bacterium]MBO6596057.1 amidohydrolase [Pseudomonadales bacterium]MBO6822540.1 amidohydrolase [Pseudomonadales bacterium]
MFRLFSKFLVSVCLCLSQSLSVTLASADDASDLVSYIDQTADKYDNLAMDIWNYAELGYLETQSSGALRKVLSDEGFQIQQGVAEIPTAFVASYGEGKPIIGILAEFDALPGISQAAIPTRQVLADKQAGHACGHHLFGAGSTAAAVAIRHWMQRNQVPGTIRLYGTPAEEGGSGKVYMVRAGLFDDVDTVLHWHPSDRNSSNAESSLANKSARFKFKGISAHAAAAPERGRSALDGVEAMNYMVNLLREHVPEQSRIHYVITRGGEAPNVVPDYAEVYYYVRHPDAGYLAGIWERVTNAAKAGALGTGTEVDIEVMHGNHSVLPNEVLSRRMHENLRKIGGVRYNEEERAFAEKISESLGVGNYIGMETRIMPFEMREGRGSTDVGDVSWTVPTVGLRTSTWVPGTAAHSWQAIAAGGTSIGTKGMRVASKALALTARDLFLDADLREAGRVEFEQRRGADFQYEALLGERKPPLDYRQ